MQCENMKAMKYEGNDNNNMWNKIQWLKISIIIQWKRNEKWLMKQKESYVTVMIIAYRENCSSSIIISLQCNIVMYLLIMISWKWSIENNNDNNNNEEK